MAKQVKLTKAEKVWVMQLNDLLAKCPSDRIAFATIGDCNVFLFDRRQYNDVCDDQELNKGEFISAARRIGAAFDEELMFPNPVESTAG